MLASAEGFTLPFTKKAPPRQTMDRRGTSGLSLRAIARFVSGPSASTVTSPGCLLAQSRMNSEAVASTAFDLGRIPPVFPRPSSPWTKSAILSFSSPVKVQSDPFATGTSALSASSSSPKAFSVDLVVGQFPKIVVSPITSTSGCRSAAKMVIASSTPGSVSMIIFLRPAIA